MNDINRNRCCVETENFLNSIDQRKKEALKNIGCSVECGYDYLGALSTEPLTDLCKYLNLWLDEQKRIHVNGDSRITEDEWNNIENIWSYLHENDSSSKCRRQKNGYNISNKDKHMKLLSYCFHRDYIKSLCESNTSISIKISPACSALYDFIEEHYAIFNQENQCIDYSVKPKDYSYHISDECSLYYMAKTFPKINVHDKKILYDDKSRTAIKACTNTAEVEDRPQEQTEDGTDGLSELPESSDDAAQSEDVHPRSESGFPESTELAHPSITSITSPNDKHSKPIYYAGLSVSGVFFTSMVLYKYTTLGPLIRSLVSKKEKLRQTTNKHLAEQWLQRTSEYMDPNSENSHYNFPYQSMQN